MTVSRTALLAGAVGAFAAAVAVIGAAGLILHWPLAAPLIAATRLLRWSMSTVYAVSPVLALGTLLAGRLLRPELDLPPGWRVIVAWALGWIAVMLVGTAMLATGLYREEVWAVAALAGNLALVLVLVARRWRPLLELKEDAARAWHAWHRGRPLGFWDLVILACLVSALLLASMPPDARDELVYHLALPQFWTFQHNWWVPLDNAHWLFPANGEVAWGYALAAGGLHAPRLLTLAFGLAMIALLATWLTEEGYEPWTARMSLAFLLLAPIALILLGSCNVEWPMVFFLLLGWRFSRRHLVSDAPRDAVLTGLAWGACLGFKYTAFPVVVGLALEWVVAITRRRGFRRMLPPLGFLALASAVLAGGWMARNWHLTGVPLYPIGASASASGESEVDTRALINYSKLSGAWRYVPWLYHATADPVTDQRLHAGWPLLLLGVVLAGWCRAGERPWLTVVGVSLLFLRYSPAARAYVPVLALAWLFLPDFLQQVASRPRLRAAVSVVMGVIALTSLPWFHVILTQSSVGAQDYLIGNIAEEELLRRAGVLTPVVRWVRTQSPVDARLWVWGGEQTFYLDRWVRASSYLEKPLFLTWFERYGEAGFTRKVVQERLDFILVELAHCAVPPTSVSTESRAWPIARDLQPVIARWMRDNLQEVTRDAKYALFLVRAPHPGWRRATPKV
ncbi:MAG: hypothetical protein ABR961_01425 [Thermoanaerobaculaceae bacterium]